MTTFLFTSKLCDTEENVATGEREATAPNGHDLPGGTARRDCRSLHLHASEDGLGLFKCLNLFVTGSLADLEVIQIVVATLVEATLRRREAIELVVHSVELRLCLRNRFLCLGLVLILVGDALGLRFNGRVGLLTELLVGLLGLVFVVGRLCHQRLGVVDDLVERHEYAAGSPMRLLVVLEVRRRQWRRTTCAPRPKEGLLLRERRTRLAGRILHFWPLAVDLLQHSHRFVQQLNRLLLVSHGLLEILVFHLPVLARALELLPEIRDLF